MWIPIRTLIVEDEPLAAEYLAILLEDTCQVKVVATVSDSEAALDRCAELRPDAVFLDINLPGKDGISLAKQLAMLPKPPRLVFTTGVPARATDAFRLDAVDYLLKPLEAEQVTEAVNRLATHLRPFESGSPLTPSEGVKGLLTNTKIDSAEELLPVKDIDRDKSRLLARYEIAAVLRRDRRTWVHTIREEFATYYPLGDLIGWLGGYPFIQTGRHAVANMRAVEQIEHYGDRLYRLRLRDRLATEITASRSGAARLAAILKR
jgi:DNA-binding LytR/AlgR family response regulator